jgi:hypothetical protein
MQVAAQAYSCRKVIVESSSYSHDGKKEQNEDKHSC